MTDLEKARELLHTGEYTCALCRGNEHYTSTLRGVRPLFEWLESGNDLRGFSAADKVVGKGAAFLYVLLGVQSVSPAFCSKATVRNQRGSRLDEALKERSPGFSVNRGR